MTFSANEFFESFVPVYDTVPENWDDAKPFFVEQLRKISNGINAREIGFFLDEEVLAGKFFYPAAGISGTTQQFRSILRKVVEFPGLVIGLNQQPHNLNITADFSMIAMYGASTNATLLTGQPLPNANDGVSYDSTNVYISSTAVYTRAYIILEYLQEL